MQDAAPNVFLLEVDTKKNKKTKKTHIILKIRRKEINLQVICSNMNDS